MASTVIHCPRCGKAAIIGVSFGVLHHFRRCGACLEIYDVAEVLEKTGRERYAELARCNNETWGLESVKRL